MAAKTGRDFPGFENEWAQGVCGRSVGLERSGCHELPKWIQQDSFPGQQTMFKTNTKSEQINTPLGTEPNSSGPGAEEGERRPRQNWWRGNALENLYKQVAMFL